MVTWGQGAAARYARKDAQRAEPHAVCRVYDGARRSSIFLCTASSVRPTRAIWAGARRRDPTFLSPVCAYTPEQRTRSDADRPSFSADVLIPAEVKGACSKRRVHRDYRYVRVSGMRWALVCMLTSSALQGTDLQTEGLHGES